MDAIMACKACGKKCSMTDSRPYSNTKERMHNRCLLKYRNAPSPLVSDNRIITTQKLSNPPHVTAKDALVSPNLIHTTDTTGVTGSSNQGLNQAKSSASSSCLNAEDKVERNKRSLEKLLEADKQKRGGDGSQFFFDLKAGIAKPHEKRSFLYHKKLQDMKVSYDDNCFKADSVGRSYDHRGKDLDNPSSSSGDNDSEDSKSNDGSDKEKDRSHKHKQLPTDSTISKRVKMEKQTEVHEKYNQSSRNHEHLDRNSNRRSQNEHSHRNNRNHQEQQPCWFCLSSPKVEKHLIIAIGDNCYLALAKGGLTHDHMLIIPIQHERSTNDIDSTEVIDEINKFKSSLVDYFGKQSKAVIFFERNFRSDHLQIQVVPINLDLMDEAEDKIKAISEKLYPPVSYMPIPNNCSIKDTVPRGKSYFLWEIEPINLKLCTKIETRGPFFPMQFGRQILTHKDILNLPDRIDWKKCAHTDDEYRDIVKSLKESYKQFDFTLD